MPMLHFYDPEISENFWFSNVFMGYQKEVSQSAFTCSKLTTETLEQGMKYVQS